MLSWLFLLIDFYNLVRHSFMRIVGIEFAANFFVNSIESKKIIFMMRIMCVIRAEISLYVLSSNFILR